MKIRNHILAVLALAFLATGCYSPEELERTDSDNVMILTVKGTLLQNSEEYDADVDEETHTVVVNIPYYISDDEELEPDLSEIKLRASSMPLGSKFEPSIGGIHDLSDDNAFVSTLVYETGEREPYTFFARRQKSSASSLTSAEVTDEDVRPVISITGPTDDNPKGKLTVLKTSGAIDAALKSVKVVASPWATIQAPGYDEETGILDLTYVTEIAVLSQDGASKTIYEVSIETPEVLPSGRIGYISGLFGFQPTVANPNGMTKDANTSMAVVDNYLILSNRLDVTEMPVYNRMSGRYLSDVKVNTTGIDTGREIMAIANDNAGHLFAVAYSSTSDTDTSNDIVRGWVWKDGIENAPTLLMNNDLNGEYYKSRPVGVNKNYAELYRTVKVYGDLTGDAVIATISPVNFRPVFEFVTDGKLGSKAYIEWPSGSVTVSFGNVATIVPLNYPSNTTSPTDLEYVWSNGNFRQCVVYVNSKAGLAFTNPTSHWWAYSGYQRPTWGADAIEFNGTRLLAVQNGMYLKSSTAGVMQYCFRLYVSNIGQSPSTSSFSSGFIFDSREGDSTGIESAGGPSGTGYSTSGMTSCYAFASGETVLGDNDLSMGGVTFAASDDGNSVQVYMLTMNQGLLGYEITRYNI